jgi:hypothetical protein
MYIADALKPFLITPEIQQLVACSGVSGRGACNTGIRWKKKEKKAKKRGEKGDILVFLPKPECPLFPFLPVMTVV